MSLSGVTTLIFEPGVWDLDPSYAGSTVDKYDLTYPMTVYIKGGAWVKGVINVATGTGAFKLLGRGTLSAEKYPNTEGLRTLETTSGSSVSTEVDGVTFSDGASHAFVSFDAGLVIRDIKIFGYYLTTDGVRLNANGLLENSFFKVNDDSVKLYGSNITVSNLVMWPQNTGSQFQLSFNATTDNGNNLIQHVSIIHNDRLTGVYTQSINGGIIGCRNLNGGDLHDMTFDDFDIEVAPYQMWSLWLKWDSVGFTDGKGSISNFTFSNWTVAAQSLEPDYFHPNGATLPGTITNLNFTNIVVNGSPLDDSNFICTTGANCASFTITP